MPMIHITLKDVPALVIKSLLYSCTFTLAIIMNDPNNIANARAHLIGMFFGFFIFECFYKKENYEF